MIDVFNPVNSIKGSNWLSAVEGSTMFRVNGHPYSLDNNLTTVYVGLACPGIIISACYINAKVDGINNKYVRNGVKGTILLGVTAAVVLSLKALFKVIY